MSEALRAVRAGVELVHGGMEDGDEMGQEMAVRYLSGDERVLEVGGGLGRTSVVIDRLQRGRRGSLVVLEADPETAAKLAENRDACGGRFRVEAGALCRRSWSRAGAGAGAVELSGLAEGRGFDALVVGGGCALAAVLDEVPEALDGVRTVIVESRAADGDHGRAGRDDARARAALLAMGLESVFRRGSCEVWKR